MTTDLVWHYTTTEGLLGIIQSNQLWASNVAFLNDPTEDLFALEAMRDALTASPEGVSRAYWWTLENMHSQLTDQEPYPDRYVLSGSEAGDNLDLWRSYGPQGIAGTYAIGLDPAVELQPWPPTNANVGASTGWQQVKYLTKQESIEIALNGFMDEFADRVRLSRNVVDEETLNDVALHDIYAPGLVLTNLLAVIKHSSYASEREQRIEITKGSRCVQIRAGAYGPTPYVPLVALDENGAPGRLPIRAVVTWPGSPPRAVAGVAAALSHGGYPHDQSSLDRSLAAVDPATTLVEIQRSAIPFVS